MSHPTVPRIPPQSPAEWSPDVRSMMTGERKGRPRLADMNIFTTLVRHPDLFKAWLPFGGFLLFEGKLSFADRELLILRTAVNCRAPYEWGQHIRIATGGGMGREVVDRVSAGPDAPGWDERQTLLLRAADELHGGSRISDSTWAGLSRYLTEQQLIELPVLVGQYHLVAFALNSLGVQPEPGLEPLPTVHS